MGLLSTVGSLAGTYFGGPAGGAVGGMIGGALEGGASTAGGMQQSAAAQKAAQEAAQAARFRPVGTTNTFGTSSFKYDPSGQMTGVDYSLSPQLAGYQTQLAGMTGQGLQASQNLMGLGMGYLGEDPNAVRQRYINEQTALLAPQQEQTLAGIRNNLFQTGRGGLATGATNEGGLAATNPEMAAYYNSLANTQRQITAGADTAAQNQIKFGTGLLTGAYDPFKAGLSAQQGVETLGQQPLDISYKFGTAAANAGSNAGQFMNTPAYGYSPQGTLLSSLGNASAGVLGQVTNPSLNPFTGNAYSWTTDSSVIPQSTFSGSGDSFAFDDSWANPASSWNTGAINGLF